MAMRREENANGDGEGGWGWRRMAMGREEGGDGEGGGWRWGGRRMPMVWGERISVVMGKGEDVRSDTEGGY